MKLLVIPDIHGRTFWKDALELEPSKIIFLGDYLDPYKEEGLHMGDAIRNFSEILDLKKKLGDKVMLLLGNHDYHYVDLWWTGKGSRFDAVRCQEISDMFHQYLEYFKLCHLERVGDINYLFTHAGISKLWLKHNGLELPETQDIPDYLNDLQRKDPYLILGQVGRSRYGRYPAGSILWAHFPDDFVENDIDPHVCQVFGHTMGFPRPLNEMMKIGLVCLDEAGKSTFMIDSSGIERIEKKDQ